MSFLDDTNSDSEVIKTWPHHAALDKGAQLDRIETIIGLLYDDIHAIRELVDIINIPPLLRKKQNVARKDNER
jgi:hypothetical protein